jgi:hypothetical protein
MSSVPQTEARHRRLSARSIALARRDYFESIRRTTVLAAHAPALLAPQRGVASTVDDEGATRLVGGLVLAALVGTVLLFREPLLAVLFG